MIPKTDIFNNTAVAVVGGVEYRVEQARYILRRGGRNCANMLKYLVGLIQETKEKIWICLGLADDIDMRGWILSHDGDGHRLALYMVEHLLTKHFGPEHLIAALALARR